MRSLGFWFSRENLNTTQITDKISEIKNAVLSNNEKKGADRMTKAEELALKKQTLEAWANLLYKEGMIDVGRCSRMVEAIGKLRA